MNRLTVIPFASLLFFAMLAAPVASQEQRNEPAQGTQGQNQWYYQGSSAPKAEKSIARQKAELRGRQRSARLESLRRQGIFVARPKVNGLPFTNTTRPAWSYYGGRPVIIIPRSYTAYR